MLADFQGSNLTAYGGLLPVATMLEKLQFRELIEEHVTIKRLTTSMPGFRFVQAMILALYVGFSRLNHLPFLGREPMLTGILEVTALPVQSSFWRFLASLHLVVARQLLEVGRQMRQRVWEAAHRSFRGGEIRSRDRRKAVASPAKANSIAFWNRASP